MKGIELENIYVTKNKIEYRFSVDNTLKEYFNPEHKFVIEYFFDGQELDITSAPSAVLAIPFVCNVLPIIWLTDSILLVNEIDEDFYDSIIEFKKGYISMFPDAVFRGTLHANKIVKCTCGNRNRGKSRTASFFSGGLDATTTVLRHLDESPTLISVWGSDIDFENANGWNRVDKAICETADIFQLHHVVIHSSFRKFDKEGELEKAFGARLHDGWWHGVKHGIGLLGHAAPLAWLYGITSVYIASSNCETDGKVTCASHPSIDSYVRFCNSKVVHDGFEMSRQDKVAYVVQYHRNHPENKILLHVCWQSQDGNNCCHCEKCYRTMVAIWTEGGNPKDFGLDVESVILKDVYKKMAIQYDYSRVIAIQWNQIKQAIINNQECLRGKPYYKDLKWIGEFDFFSPEKNRCRRWRKIKIIRGIRKVFSGLRNSIIR